MELAEKRGQKKVLPVLTFKGSGRPKGVHFKVAKKGQKLRKNDAKKP